MWSPQNMVVRWSRSGYLRQSYHQKYSKKNVRLFKPTANICPVRLKPKWTNALCAILNVGCLLLIVFQSCGQASIPVLCDHKPVFCGIPRRDDKLRTLTDLQMLSPQDILSLWRISSCLLLGLIHRNTLEFEVSSVFFQCLFVQKEEIQNMNYTVKFWTCKQRDWTL